MSNIFERLGSLSGTELAKATHLAHQTYQSRMADHGHTGRALVETVAHVCRNHPGLVGIGVGLMVEQLLAHEKHAYDKTHAPDGTPLPGTQAPAKPAMGEPLPHPLNHHLPFDQIKLANIRPGHIAGEVFGALVLLKIASTGVRMFRHKHQGETWFNHAARIRLFSGSIGAYYLAKSLKLRKPSAWTNAFAALFLTDALKPVLKRDPKWRPTPEMMRQSEPEHVAEVTPMPMAPPAAANAEPTPAERARAAALYAAQHPQPPPPSQTFEGHGEVTQPVSIGGETLDPQIPTFAPTAH
ncbi:MAG TPA: hypothetical protein VG407_10920 [Caulobacteraceae bacterium]|jgi:hypothetical protein|nr:hypothetical protein [Caulobacteraceae bacterium]